MAWTAEQVIALAPDPSAAKAGRELASERRWSNLGQSESALWGECKGSAAQPYQTQIDLSEPAFRCTCPSRKFPCKHSLGLFLIYAARPGALAPSTPPDWVRAWLDARAAKTAKAATPKAPAKDADPEKAAAQAAQRAARRVARAGEGIGELELWLRDMLAEGLAELPRRPQSFWALIASHMVDAQLPGLARAVEELSAIPNSGPGWPDRMLARLGRLQLLVEAAERLETLESGLQAEVRAAIGFNESKDDVLKNGESVGDDWQVAGRWLRVEDRLRMQRTWLRGINTARICLVLDFAAGNQPLDPSLIPGTHFEGEVRFYSGAHPVRGLVASRRGDPSPLESLIGEDRVDAALNSYATLRGASPFFDRAPMSLAGVTPRTTGGGWYLVDAGGSGLRLAGGPACWRIQAMSGGRPLAVFGEWDGARLNPLSAYAEGEFANLQWLRPR
jgi:SWIM zinc finger